MDRPLVVRHLDILIEANMKHIMIIFVALSLALLSCDLEPQGPPELSDEEYAVISTVIDSIMHNHPSETIDVYDLTITLTNCSSLHLAFEQDSVGSDSLLANYDHANLIRYSMDMDKLPDYVMLKDALETDPYAGLIAFTRPGISDDGLWAIVEYNIWSETLGSSFTGILLNKQSNQWTIIWGKAIPAP